MADTTHKNITLSPILDVPPISLRTDTSAWDNVFKGLGINPQVTDTQGINSFQEFHQCIQAFDEERREFITAAGHLGAFQALRVLSSSSDLQYRLFQTLYLLHQNAVYLFSRQEGNGPDKLWQLPTPSLDHDDQYQARPKMGLKWRQLPERVKDLAASLQTFIECLDEFSDVGAENLISSTSALATEIEWWASSLELYQERIKSNAVRRFAHSISEELRLPLDRITHDLKEFVHKALPRVQEHAAKSLVTVSTVATFLSGVTATTLQMSISAQDTSGSLTDVVNGFWFTSLALSIGAALNSVLGLTWKQGRRHVRHMKVPTWVLILIEQSPLVFLALSVACFIMGFALFAYSSKQKNSVATVTSVTSACSCFAVILLSILLLWERWAFNKPILGKLLVNLWTEAKDMRQLRDFYTGARPRTRRQFQVLRQHVHGAFHSLKNKLLLLLAEPREMQPLHADSSFATGHAAIEITVKAKERWIRLLKGIKGDTDPIHDRKVSRDPEEYNLERKTALFTRPSSSIQAEGQQLAVFLRFSLDGSLLATSNGGFSFTVRQGPFQGDKIKVTRFPGKGYITQISWAPDGGKILTKMGHGAQLWQNASDGPRQVTRAQYVRSITWMPDSESFLLVGANVITRYNLSGEVLTSYDLNKKEIYLKDAAIVKNNQRILILCVGIDKRLPPYRGRGRNVIVVYHFEGEELKMKDRLPIFHDVQSIMTAQNELIALVGYHKAPPQLWNLYTDTEYLSLRRTFCPGPGFNFQLMGPTCFGGLYDQLVLHADKDCGIHIWCRDSGSLLHHISPRDTGRNLVAIDWRRSPQSFMFATASQDGKINLWDTNASGVQPDENHRDENIQTSD